jgi:hypothetical protein
MDKFTVRGSDGSVDVSASANAYAKALTEWVGKNEIATETIESAVEAVFDAFPDQRLAMPSLLHEAVSRLNGTPASHKTLSERVHAYIKGQTADNTGRLDVQKGKGGGVLRLARPGEEIPARAAKKSA